MKKGEESGGQCYPPAPAGAGIRTEAVASLGGPGRYHELPASGVEGAGVLTVASASRTRLRRRGRSCHRDFASVEGLAAERRRPRRRANPLTALEHGQQPADLPGLRLIDREQLLDQHLQLLALRHPGVALLQQQIELSLGGHWALSRLRIARA